MEVLKKVKEHVNWADGIYPKHAPKEVLEDNNKTFILVRDNSQELSLFGSDTFLEVQSEVSIQVFYSIKSTFDFDEKEIELMKFLESQGMRITQIRGRVQDPDTFQDFQTIIVKTRKETI